MVSWPGLSIENGLGCWVLVVENWLEKEKQGFTMVFRGYGEL
jgi:hypothetical protein